MAYKKKQKISNISAAAIVIMVVAILLWLTNIIVQKLGMSVGPGWKRVVAVATSLIVGISMVAVGSLLLAVFPVLGGAVMVLGLVVIIAPFFNPSFDITNGDLFTQPEIPVLPEVDDEVLM